MFRRGRLSEYFLDSPNEPGFQSHLDPVRMRRGIGENILHDPLGAFPCPLVLLEDDSNPEPRVYIASDLSVHLCLLSMKPVREGHTPLAASAAVLKRRMHCSLVVW